MKIFKEEDVFLQPKSVGDREWGTEELLYNCDGFYSFKLLTIKKGMKGGLQYHHFKDECTFIVSGELEVCYDLNDGEGLRTVVLRAGQSIRFPTGMVHQEHALTDVVRVEVSTPYYNDRVRVESSYGMGDPVGLQTTKVSEVIKR